MANQELVQRLRSDVDKWNAWRAENKSLLVDLRGGVLRGLDLREADLSNADLREADLCNADLYGADLSEADLSGADLFVAKLQNANLSGANLCNAHIRVARFDNADLSGAKLSGAEPGGANLSGANLSGVDFNGLDLNEVFFRETILSNVNLSGAQNLERCRHRGPSTIDHRTLEKSGMLPEIFLRGCGLSDWQIEYSKLYRASLSNEDVCDICSEIARIKCVQPIQLFKPFISYSSSDNDFAQRLYDDLQNNGVRCWFAPEDMKIGDRMRQRIDEVIHVYDRLLLILSKHSVRSDWVEKEVETAFEKERDNGETVLFPIKLDDAVDKIKTGWAADIRRTRHIGDFTGLGNPDTYQKAFDRVLRDLRV